MSTAQLLSNNIKGTKNMINMFLKDFTDADMYYRPVKSANNATWQLGHLCNATLGMVKSCSPDTKFPFEDDARFGKSKASIDDPTFFPKKADLLARFDQAMDAASAWVATLSDAQIAAESPERLRAFAPTVGDVALLLGTHPLLHIGQFTVMRRGLGKPVIF